MQELSPYLLERSSGLLHVRLRADGGCIGHVELAIGDIIVAETYMEARREALAEAREAAERAAVVKK